MSQNEDLVICLPLTVSIGELCTEISEKLKQWWEYSDDRGLEICWKSIVYIWYKIIMGVANLIGR